MFIAYGIECVRYITHMLGNDNVAAYHVARQYINGFNSPDEYNIQLSKVYKSCWNEGTDAKWALLLALEGKFWKIPLYVEKAMQHYYKPKFFQLKGRNQAQLQSNQMRIDVVTKMTQDFKILLTS